MLLPSPVQTWNRDIRLHFTEYGSDFNQNEQRMI